MSLTSPYSERLPSQKGRDGGIAAGFQETGIRLGVDVCERLTSRLSEKSDLAKALRLAAKTLRKISCRRTVRRYANEPWMKEILRCQDEIASCDPSPLYLSTYRDKETYYWLHVPKWIYEDSRGCTFTRCLDIGCAYGTLALFCKRVCRCDIHCVDVFDTYLSMSLAKKHGLDFRLCNIETDPLPWNLGFDVVILTEVLEHLNFNPVPTLAKIGSLLSENGRLYLSTPDAQEAGRVTKYYSSWTEIPHPTRGGRLVDEHIYQYSKDELFEVVNRAGLRVERMEYSPGVGVRHFNTVLVKK